MKSNRDGIVTVALLCCLGGCAAALSVGFVMSWLAPLSPVTYDLYLYRADRLLGYDALRVMPTFEATGWLYSLAARVYLALPFALVAAVGLAGIGRAPRVLVARLALTPVLGILLYQVVPACGPVFVPTREFAGPPHPLALSLTIWRNAMPSLHLTWALLLWPAWGRARWILGSAFVAFTAAFCLGAGQHYLVDLVVSVPFTILVVWLAPREQVVKK